MKHEIETYKLKSITFTNSSNNKQNLNPWIATCKLQPMSICQTTNKTRNHELQVATYNFYQFAEQKGNMKPRTTSYKL
jgi:hypothetical protein